MNTKKNSASNPIDPAIIFQTGPRRIGAEVGPRLCKNRPLTPEEVRGLTSDPFNYQLVDEPEWPKFDDTMKTDENEVKKDKKIDKKKNRQSYQARQTNRLKRESSDLEKENLQLKEANKDHQIGQLPIITTV